jgi:hypothetical protein
MTHSRQKHTESKNSQALSRPGDGNIMMALLDTCTCAADSEEARNLLKQAAVQPLTHES